MGSEPDDFYDDFYGDDYDNDTCPDCDGEGVVLVCFDDLCQGSGHCIHGDGWATCRTCGGAGELAPCKS